MEHEIFGDLDGQQVGGQITAGQRATQVAGQLCVAEERGKEVDRDRYPRAGGVPPDGVSEHLVEDEVGDGTHQSVLPHERQELTGQQQSALRVRPPQQGFDADDVTGLQAHLWLIGHGEVAVVDGVT